MKNINVEVSMTDMEKLFAPDGFFHGCIKEEILSEGSKYYTCKSTDSKLLLLIQVLPNESEPTTLAFLPWKEAYKKINPWLFKKNQSHFNSCPLEPNEYIPPKVQKPKFTTFGMLEWPIAILT